MSIAASTTARTPELDAMSIPEFCSRYSISETFYRVLRRKGLGPRELRLSRRRVLITVRSAREWETSFEERKAAIDAAATRDTTS
ncbi:hypothetical protein [Paraburkholderia youngii]|uniref:AlpA family phage regulatory protein n=1 Tax=Paraburkholderia youngii TaxID=2782701 RepID=A0A7W8LCL9_9BURK|nr:hypothetical protein [Paraburkholderia youngii]MBB5403226.1 hypothetical protein [Paraburkholderia youngii]